MALPDVQSQALLLVIRLAGQFSALEAFIECVHFSLVGLPRLDLVRPESCAPLNALPCSARTPGGVSVKRNLSNCVGQSAGLTPAIASFALRWIASKIRQSTSSLLIHGQLRNSPIDAFPSPHTFNASCVSCCILPSFSRKLPSMSGSTLNNCLMT